jgi:hypothetical protein
MLHELETRSRLQSERNRSHSAIAKSSRNVGNHLRATPTDDPVGQAVLGYTLDVDSLAMSVEVPMELFSGSLPPTMLALRDTESVGKVDEADVLKGKGQEDARGAGLHTDSQSPRRDVDLVDSATKRHRYSVRSKSRERNSASAGIHDRTSRDRAEQIVSESDSR